MAPPPAAGNVKYIAVVAVLVAGMIALLLFKACGDKPTSVAVIPQAQTIPSTPTTGLRIDDIPLVPEIPDAAEPPKHTVTANPMAGCDQKKCQGDVTPELESALAFRAKQAHRCYDSALAQDSTLAGKIRISVRVAANGNVCAAGIASNEMSNPNVGNCVANMFRSSGHFPAPRGGCLDANVPISFVPGGR